MSILSNNDTIEDIKCWVNNNSSDIEYVYTQDGKLVFSKYTEIEDSPPLLYNSKKNNLALKNYRIYGNTINGESVGDRTGNLFDGNFLRGYWAYANGEFIYVPSWICTTKIPCAGGQMYTCSFSKASRWLGFVWYDGNGDYISTNNRQDGSNTQYRLYCATAPSNATYMAINIAGYPDYSATILPSDITDFMLVEGQYTIETMPAYEPYGYRIPVTVTNGTDTQTTNLYLLEQIKKVGDEAEYVDFGEQKHHKVRKNLLQNTAVTQTKNGVTFTINDDGSVTCNGTPTQEKPTYIVLNVPEFEDGQYILSGCPAGGGANSYYLRIYKPGPNLSGGSTRNDYGNGGTFTYGNHVEDTSVNLFVAYGYVCENITFYPMIRKSNIEDDTYEQYIENTELDVTLPTLSTLSGTNTLSVGTNIQPSSVYLKGKIQSKISE